MSDKVHLSSFPSNEIQALAMLYVQNQNLKGKSTDEIMTIYLTAYYKISKKYKEVSNNVREELEV